MTRYRQGWFEVQVYRTPTQWAVQRVYNFHAPYGRLASVDRRRYVKTQEKAEQVAEQWRAAA